jgi:hypothetical protein
MDGQCVEPLDDLVVELHLCHQSMIALVRSSHKSDQANPSRQRRSAATGSVEELRPWATAMV